MYLKIKSFKVEFGEGVGNEPKVCYPRCYLYDCRKVVAKMHDIHSYQGYCDIVDPLLEVSHPPIDIIGEQPENGRFMQLLELLITDKSGIDQRIIAVAVDAYLMNDDGKTVDRWNCSNCPI